IAFDLAVRSGETLVTAVFLHLWVVGKSRIQQHRTAGHAEREAVGAVPLAVAVPGLEDVQVEGHLDPGVRRQPLERQAHRLIDPGAVRVRVAGRADWRAAELAEEPLAMVR